MRRVCSCILKNRNVENWKYLSKYYYVYFIVKFLYTWIFGLRTRLEIYIIWYCDDNEEDAVEISDYDAEQDILDIENNE